MSTEAQKAQTASPTPSQETSARLTGLYRTILEASRTRQRAELELGHGVQDALEEADLSPDDWAMHVDAHRARYVPRAKEEPKP